MISQSCVIAVSGKMQSGKDTFYQLVKNLLPDDKYDVVRFALADPLKAMVSTYLGTANVDISSFSKEDKVPGMNFSLREIYQGLGYSFRTWKSDVWVANLLLRIQDYCLNKKDDRISVIIITDVRYPNEVELLRKTNDPFFYAFRVERSGLTRDQSVNEHISETALDDYKEWDYIIKNDTTLHDYGVLVQLALDSINAKQSNL